MTVNADWREKMTDDRNPRIGFVVIDDYTDDYSDWTGQITFPNPKGANIYWQNPISFIELEPTLQLMKEMGEALKENGLSHDFDCGRYVNGRHECSCGYLKSKEVLEKYRKFLEGLK